MWGFQDLNLSEASCLEQGSFWSVFFQYSYEDSMKEQNLYAKFCFLVCDDVEPGKNIALFEWIRLDPFSTATQKMDSFETFF